MSTEQEVRTRAGWIGVEISRSRVRTPGRAGHGLYRVRGSVGRTWHETRELVRSAVTPDLHGERGPWTAYAFGLDEIDAAVRKAIDRGMPATPEVLRLSAGGEAVWVPTRWTSAYSGRRDLGVAVPVTVKPEFAAEVSALAVLVGAGLVEMRHVDRCVCDPPDRFTAACVVANRETVRDRQRAANAAFQAEHKPARDAGLVQRHARKLARGGE